MMRQPLALSALGLATVANAWTGDNCKKFSEIYTNGSDLINRMWGDSFKYEVDETKAYTMWWTEGGAAGEKDSHDNPNDVITRAIIGTVDNKMNYTVEAQQCLVSYLHKEGPPTKQTADFTECHPWHANACCHEATVVTPEAINNAYGAGYEWDRCGKLSQACERFFVEEACMYECEANIGAFRKYTDEEKTLCTAEGVAVGATVTKPSDGSSYTCVDGGIDGWTGLPKNDEGVWQIKHMPIKASYADAFYRACFNDQFCDSGSFWDCKAKYHEHLDEVAALAVKAAELKANETAAAEAQLAADLKAEKDKGLEGWAIALIVILLLLGVACCGFVAMLVMKEKQGKPMFVNMPAEKDVQMNKA
jgi:folate receptor